MNLHFDRHVPPGGYAWWYLDAWSSDGRQGLAMIAFVGSVFSPYYAWARRRGGGVADPERHCALNVALYGAPGQHVPRGWTMTERGAAHVERSAAALRIGPSTVECDGSSLTVRIDEVTAPWPRRVRGTVRLRAPRWWDTAHSLDDAGVHQWRPVAPHAEVEVDLHDPGVRWHGTGYLDTNWGARPLAADFERWDWSRAQLGRDGAVVAYDVIRRAGGERRIALAFGDRGVEALPPSGQQVLPRTGWRLPRQAAVDRGARASVVQTLEDGPFYSRSRVQSRLDGHDVVAMHESLSLDRWQQPVVQAMLPFRMPRRA